MDSYNLSYTLGFEQQKRLSNLARRCKGVKYPAASSGVFDPRCVRQLSVQARPLGSLLAGINGWGVPELLQHVVTANYKADIDLKLDFLEDKVARLENQFCIQTAREQQCISDEEHANCQRVADVFSEIYSADLLILDAGRYGFVKLQYFHPPFGYGETGIFTTGKDLFNDLWNEWISLRLLTLTKGTPMADLDYQDMFQCLPAEKQQEFLDKRNYFLDRSGITL